MTRLIASVMAVVALLCIGLLLGGRYLHTRAVEKEALEGTVRHDIWDLYNDFFERYGRRPRELADLRKLVQDHTPGFKAIESGRWDMDWGAQPDEPIAGNRRVVIAHEDRLVSGRGWVIFSDGSCALEWAEQYRADCAAREIGQELVRAYLDFQRKQQRPPRDLADLSKNAQLRPDLLAAVVSGTWTVVWNAVAGSDKENRDIVVAYESRVGIGWCCMVTIDGWASRVDESRLKGWLNEAPIAHDIWRVYWRYSTDHGEPPVRLEDLASYETSHPAALEAIRAGKWIVCWGTKIKQGEQADAAKLIAYEKTVLTRSGEYSGWAVFGDNSAGETWKYELERHLGKN
jgi:hypothetical protein